MNQPNPLPAPEHGKRVFVGDPVRITWVIVSFVNTVIATLLITGSVDETLAGIIVAVSGALYVAMSELWVRQTTVALKPLNQFAEAVQAEATAQVEAAVAAAPIIVVETDPAAMTGVVQPPPA